MLLYSIFTYSCHYIEYLHIHAILWNTYISMLLYRILTYPCHFMEYLHIHVTIDNTYMSVLAESHWGSYITGYGIVVYLGHLIEDDTCYIYI